MPAQRRKNLLRRRRRVDDDADDEGSIITEPVDDSHSEASLPSDDDADADDSDLSETDGPDTLHNPNSTAKSNGAVKTQTASPPKAELPAAASAENTQSFSAVKDTEIMMNGLQLSQRALQTEVLDFDTAGDGTQMKDETTPEPATSNIQRETLAERRQREQRERDEYKKKQAADPAFIPNRGAFFMHDHRSGPGPNGFRQLGRGRGRGRGGSGRAFSPIMPANEATDSRWVHDLHESLLEPQTRPGAQVAPASAPTSAPTAPASTNTVPVAPAEQGPLKTAIPRSFSTVRQVGSIIVRVSLPGMKESKVIEDVKVRQYAKLPNHRPPLRRDKPVRISLPDHAVRYIFPATERSFIFIPRALRPNQQGFGRGRGRGLGSLGGFSSRRTSIYGGSIYSPSVAMSRRSSIARDFTRDGLVSPAGSIMSGRPVVRLPPGSQQHTASGTPINSATISGTGTPVTAFPPQIPAPQIPTYRENWPANIQMHQPRPQKTISVTGIETPASLHYQQLPQAPQQDQQPFHHQVPQHVGPPAGPDQPYYAKQHPYPSQPASGTPLSNIPERAIHAQPFQPLQQAPSGYQPQTFPGQPTYMYAQPNGSQQYGPNGPAVIAPMYIQDPQQGSYLVPTIAQPSQPVVHPSTSMPGSSTMVAHEQNGTVYYIDPSQLQYVPQEGYSAQQGFQMQGMPNVMTPAPGEYNYYPPMPTGGPVYYPAQ